MMDPFVKRIMLDIITMFLLSGLIALALWILFTPIPIMHTIIR